MKREQFMAELKRSLGRMSEEEIAQALGTPRVIGSAYAIDALLEEPAEGGQPRAASVLRAVFASLSLTVFNVIFILGPFLGLVGVLVGLWATAVALGASGLAVVVSPIVALAVPGIVALGGMSAPFLVFAGIGLAGLGALAAIGMVLLTRLFVRGTAAYVRLNARIVTRRK